jgi:voltage-gated potassium channel
VEWGSPLKQTDTRNLVILVAALLATVVVGTAGFMLIEHLGLVDAVYMTVITLSTVGFGEVKPLSAAGRLFTIALLVIGVGLIAYTLGTIIEFVVSGELTGLFRRRAMERRLAELDGHYIICGYGRVGEAVAKEFARNRSSFVVVDRDPETVARIVEEGFLVLHGDATVDEILVAAGVERAAGLVAAVNTDADNTFVVLSARVLNPRLIIVARANSDETIGKLEKAGATKVISPYGLGGRRMASILLQPLVTDYLEVVTGAGELSFRLEEFALNATCEVVGRSIKDLDIRRLTGASILAVRHGSGAFNTNPDPDLVLSEEDTVVAIGTPEEMVRLEQHFACRLPAR